MEQQIVRQKAQEFIDALHGLEQGEQDDEAALDRLVSLYAADAHLTNAALRLTGEERIGTEAIRSFWSEYKRTLGKAYSTFPRILVDEEAAGLFWTTRAGDSVYEGVTLLAFDGDGLIQDFQGFYDTQRLQRTIGTDAASTAG